MQFNLMILAADPESAEKAQYAGVDRIFYDLEYINKAERQRNRDTVKSLNSIDALPAVREVVKTSQLLVRTNPIHAYSQPEIDKAVRYGADILMLPMVVDQHDVQNYVDMVAGRARVCIMIETAQALTRIDKILAVPGVDEVFIGLNDLHISLGLAFMFEPLSGGLVEYLAGKCHAYGVPFGFGGIARIGEGILPSDYILGEHVRLHSQSVILSRTFKGEVGRPDAGNFILKDEIQKVRDRLVDIHFWSEEDHLRNRRLIMSAVDKIVMHVSQKNS